MQKLAKRVPHFEDEILRWVILRGLRPWIKASIIAQKGNLKSVADILVCAKVAESASLGKDDGSADATEINQLMEEVTAGRLTTQCKDGKDIDLGDSIPLADARTPSTTSFIGRSSQCTDTATLHDFIVLPSSSRFMVNQPVPWPPVWFVRYDASAL